MTGIVCDEFAPSDGLVLRRGGGTGGGRLLRGFVGESMDVELTAEVVGLPLVVPPQYAFADGRELYAFATEFRTLAA